MNRNQEVKMLLVIIKKLPTTEKIFIIIEKAHRYIKNT